jgi:hypothetical protein
MFASMEKGVFQAARDGVLKVAAQYYKNVRAFAPEAIEWI